VPISTDAPARPSFTDRSAHRKTVGLHARAVRAVLADDVHGPDRVVDAVAGILGAAVDDATFSAVMDAVLVRCSGCGSRVCGCNVAR
jgi:hypothetical protein